MHVKRVKCAHTCGRIARDRFKCVILISQRRNNVKGMKEKNSETHTLGRLFVFARLDNNISFSLFFLLLSAQLCQAKVRIQSISAFLKLTPIRVFQKWCTRVQMKIPFKLLPFVVFLFSRAFHFHFSFSFPRQLNMCTQWYAYHRCMKRVWKKRTEKLERRTEEKQNQVER